MTQLNTPTNENEKENPPKIGQETISQVLTLVDTEYKKITYDCYSTQMANARNYLWLFFLVISFCIAFFREAALGSTLLRLVEGNPVSAFYVVTLLSFIFVFITAVTGFWLGISTISQNNVALPYDKVSDMLTDLENERFDLLETYQFKRDLLGRLHTSLNLGIEGLERRGKILRKLSCLFKYSLTGILITLIFYGATFIR